MRVIWCYSGCSWIFQGLDLKKLYKHFIASLFMLSQLHIRFWGDFWEDEILNEAEPKMTQPREAVKTHSGWLDYKGAERDSETERSRGSMFVAQRHIKTKEVRQTGSYLNWVLLGISDLDLISLPVASSQVSIIRQSQQITRPGIDSHSVMLVAWISMF